MSMLRNLQNRIEALTSLGKQRLNVLNDESGVSNSINSSVNVTVVLSKKEKFIKSSESEISTNGRKNSRRVASVADPEDQKLDRLEKLLAYNSEQNPPLKIDHTIWTLNIRDDFDADLMTFDDLKFPLPIKWPVHHRHCDAAFVNGICMDIELLLKFALNHVQTVSKSKIYTKLIELTTFQEYYILIFWYFKVKYFQSNAVYESILLKLIRKEYMKLIQDIETIASTSLNKHAKDNVMKHMPLILCHAVYYGYYYLARKSRSQLTYIFHQELYKQILFLVYGTRVTSASVKITFAQSFRDDRLLSQLTNDHSTKTKSSLLLRMNGLDNNVDVDVDVDDDDDDDEEDDDDEKDEKDEKNIIDDNKSIASDTSAITMNQTISDDSVIAPTTLRSSPDSTTTTTSTARSTTTTTTTTTTNNNNNSNTTNGNDSSTSPKSMKKILQTNVVASLTSSINNENVTKSYPSIPHSIPPSPTQSHSPSKNSPSKEKTTKNILSRSKDFIDKMLGDDMYTDDINYKESSVVNTDVKNDTSHSNVEDTIPHHSTSSTQNVTISGQLSSMINTSMTSVQVNESVGESNILTSTVSNTSTDITENATSASKEFDKFYATVTKVAAMRFTHSNAYDDNKNSRNTGGNKHQKLLNSLSTAQFNITTRMKNTHDMMKHATENNSSSSSCNHHQPPPLSPSQASPSSQNPPSTASTTTSTTSPTNMTQSKWSQLQQKLFTKIPPVTQEDNSNNAKKNSCGSTTSITEISNNSNSCHSNSNEDKVVLSGNTNLDTNVLVSESSGISPTILSTCTSPSSSTHVTIAASFTSSPTSIDKNIEENTVNLRPNTAKSSRVSVRKSTKETIDTKNYLRRSSRVCAYTTDMLSPNVREHLNINLPSTCTSCDTNESDCNKGNTVSSDRDSLNRSNSVQFRKKSLVANNSNFISKGLSASRINSLSVSSGIN